MINTASRFDITSADNKIIGFEYQYYYFMKELIELKEGQTIGFEVKDDVHIDVVNKKQITTKLIQLKHTVSKNSKGEPINVTDLDKDLWKSISNWCKVICDSVEGRGKIQDQHEYLKITDFLLVTNKNILGNKMFHNIEDLKNGKLKFKVIKDYLKELENKTTDSTIKKYLNDILQVNDRVLEKFFKRIEFITTSDNIIEEIKTAIRRKMIADSKVNDVFNSVYSVLKSDFFETVKNGEHQQLTYEEWYSKFTPFFERQRDTMLPIRKFENMYSEECESLLDQEFIKELIDIGEIRSDSGEIYEFSEFMLTMKMHLSSWYEDGLITQDDIQKFHNNAFNIWKINHKNAHRGTKAFLYDKKMLCYV